MKKLHILVLGYIIRGPIGGMTWHYLQYCLGLKKLGHNVFFFEDSGDSDYCCYDPERGINDKNPAYGLKYATEVFEKYGLENKWAYYDKHKNQWHGTNKQSVMKIIDEADVLINVSIANPIRSWFEKIPVKILIDTDPVFTQIRNLTDPERNDLCTAHNYFFTFGENFGRINCLMPEDGFQWKPTRQPVFLDAWKTSAVTTNNKWTTVMQWESYSERHYNGRNYGMKSKSFKQYINIPAEMRDEAFLLATGSAPAELLLSHGWNIVNSLEISKTIESYQLFIESSKGEFSIAKHGYASANSGWFSERSACYLASGKPVVVQNTGFSENLPTGIGLLAFNSVEEASSQIKQVSSNYSHHCKVAREIAESYFNSDKILIELLEHI